MCVFCGVLLLWEAFLNLHEHLIANQPSQSLLTFQTISCTMAERKQRKGRIDKENETRRR